MPRNSSGVYQLPAGNPVATGTLIASAWANVTLDDIGQAITASLDRFGSSTMAAALLLNDGTVAAPGISFGAEPSTGIWRKATKVLGVTLGGIEAATFTQAGMTVAAGIAGNLTGKGTTSGGWTIGPLNSAGNLKLDGYADTGGDVDINALSTDGTGTATIRLFRNTNTTGVRAFQILRGDNSGTVDHLFTCGTTGVSSLARFGGRFLIGGTTDNTIDALQVMSNARVRNGASGVGSNAAAIAGYDEFVIEGSGQVGMSFLTPANSQGGIAWGDPAGLAQGFILYNHATDQLHIGAAASDNLILDAAYTRSTFPFYAPDGTAALPSYAFTTQPTWGLFRVGAVGIGFTVSGVEAARIAAAGMTLSAGIAALMHGDTTTNMSICAASSLIDGVARIDLYDSAHATLQRQITLRGRGIVFTDSNTATEKGRFTNNTTSAEFLVGGISAPYLPSVSGKGIIEVYGSGTAYLGLSVASANRGYLGASGATVILSSATASIPVILALAGTEVARVDTDSTLQYTAPTIGQFEVGFRGMPLQTKSAAYTLHAYDRGCCINQTAVANVILAAVFSAGDVVAIWNNSGASIGIVPNSSVTYKYGIGGGYIASNTTSRSLAKNGWAVLVFDAANSCRLSGDGLT